MEIESALKCVRPLIYEHDNEDYPYTVGGSSFLATYDGTLFVVTASHCLRQSNYTVDASQVSVFIDVSLREFLTIDRVQWVTRPDGSNDDYTDIVLLRVAAGSVADEHLPLLNALDVNWHLSNACKAMTPTDKMFVKGYPTELLAVDYDQSKIFLQGFVADGEFDGQCEHVIGRYRLRFRDLSQITDMNGVSGSPVFQICREADISQRARLCGMVIRGSVESRIGRFLSHRTLFQAMRKALTA